MQDFVPTKGQGDALRMSEVLVKAKLGRPAIGQLCGFAGTGKTTLLKVIGQLYGRPLVIAFTGKAALRVTEATGLPASTIHRWLFKPTQNVKTGEVSFTRKSADELEVPESGLVIIDEASMPDAELWEEIYNACDEIGCNILCVGDPFQLPPVTKNNGEYFSLLAPEFKYDYTVTLTEILRQALDSPIIRASMMVRAGDVNGALFELDRVLQRDVYEKANQILLDGDGVVIVHQNTTRHHFNQEIRKIRNYDPKLQPDEPLLVLKNNYEMGVFNGEIVKFKGFEVVTKPLEVYDRYSQMRVKTQFGRAQIDGTTAILALDGVHGGLEDVNFSAIEKVGKYELGKQFPVLNCNFGYTLTAHKSQGSEWDKVLVVVEPSVRVDTTEGKRWVYTSITRSKQEAYICYGLDLRK